MLGRFSSSSTGPASTIGVSASKRISAIAGTTMDGGSFTGGRGSLRRSTLLAAISNRIGRRPFVAGAAGAMAPRQVRDKAKKIAAHLLEVSEEDLEWEQGKFFVKGSPDQAKTIQEIAFAAYTDYPQGMEAGLEAVSYYDPPNLTYPFGSYICVVDIDRGTGEVKVRRFVAVDDCGIRINPMIVEGQIHGGLTMGFAPALLEEISYDENGNMYGSSFQDYLLPTSVETPKWETGTTVTPSPHHPQGLKGVGESATVGAPVAIVNAVVDALWHIGVRHVDIPMTPPKVWALLKEHGAALEQ